MSPYVPAVPGNPIQAQNLNQVINSLNGTASAGQAIAMTALNDATNYALTVQNKEATNTRALNVLKSDGTSMIRVDSSGVTLGSPLNLVAGSITTSAIAAGAISQTGLAIGTTSAPTTTSGTYVDLPEMSVTLTTTGGRLLAFLAGSFWSVTAGNAVVVALSLDGAAEVGDLTTVSAVANTAGAVTCIWDFGSPTAGSHTIKGRWNSSSATTVTAAGIRRRLLVVELKK